MLKEEVISGNIWIAKSQGWVIDNSFPDKGKVWRSPNGKVELESTLKFHSDWTELHSVINNLKPRLEKDKVACSIIRDSLFSNEIEEVWNAIVIFLMQNSYTL